MDNAKNLHVPHIISFLCTNTNPLFHTYHFINGCVPYFPNLENKYRVIDVLQHIRWVPSIDDHVYKIRSL